MKQKVGMASLVFCLMILSLLKTECQALLMYDNVAAPSGLYFLDYPAYCTADRLKDGDGDTSIDDLDLNSYTNTFRLLYYNRTTFKNTWAWSACLPVGRAEMLGDHDAGLGDLALAAGYWVVDDPNKKTWLAPTLFVDAPIGDYDSDKSINMGTNVWKFKPTILFAKYFGRVTTEAFIRYTMYTENNDTEVANGDEINFESFIGYFITPSLNSSVHFNATFGEDNELNGHKLSDSGIRKYQAGASIFWQPERSGMLNMTFQYFNDFGCENTFSGDTFLIRLTWKIN